MKIHGFVIAAALGAVAPGAFVPAAFAKDAPPPAPAAPVLTVGAAVFDPQGLEVGRIVALSGGNVVIDTGKHRATIEAASIGSTAKGPAIAFNRAQLDAAVEGASKEASARLDAALVAGTAVKSQDGVAVGTVKEVNAQGNVVIQREGERPVALPKDTLVLNAAGEVSLLFTAAQFDAAIGKAAARLEAAAPAVPSPASR